MTLIDIESPEFQAQLEWQLNKAEPWYDPNAPYHHFQTHICQEVLPVAMNLVKSSLRRRLTFDPVAPLIGAVWHDAGATWPILNNAYNDVEERARHLAMLHMDPRYFSDTTVVRTGDSIAATARFAPYLRIEDALLGIPDLINVSYPYPRFLRRTADARQEAVLFSPRLSPLSDWLADTPKVLEDFALKPVPAALQDDPMIQDIRERSRYNIERLKRETAASFCAKVGWPLTAALS